MKKYLITFGSISTTIGLGLALYGAEIGALALCISASATFIAASILKPTSNLGGHEAMFFLAIGSIGQEGITIDEIKKKMMSPLSTSIVSDEELNSIIMNTEIEGIIEYKEGKLYRIR